MSAIPAGYKQTEVGVIPEDWDDQPLHEGIKLLSGHHVLAQHCNTKGYGTPYITGPADFPNGIIENSKFTEKPTTLCRKDDILVTVKGSGAGTIVLAGSEYCISRQLMAVRVTGWETGYIHECLKRESSLFGSAATGLIPGLSRGDILNKRIPLPPLPEQRAIAAALSDVDALLAKLAQIIAKKRDLKQAAMQQLLTGQTRLPGFSGAWEVKRLGELLAYEQPTKYLVRSSEYSDSNDVPVLTAGKTFVLGFTHETEGIFAELPAIIFDDFTTATKFVTFPFKTKSSAMKILKPRNPSVNLRLVYEIMQLIDFKLGDHKRYWISEYSKLEVKLPEVAEQTAIATILSDMDAEIAALEARRDKTRALKQGMMQELLTGRIRLV